MVSSPVAKKSKGEPSDITSTNGIPHLGVHFPKILLPAPSKVDFKKWAIVACDQYSSEEDYWARVEALVGDSPSTLRLTFPEVYLDKGKDEEIIAGIKASMASYEAHGIFSETQTNGVVFVERTLHSGVLRRGIVLAIDLECYSFHSQSKSVVRATEKTIESRIPPRLKIRKSAPLELPHVIVLIDDVDDVVISSLAAHCSPETEIYETELMEHSGHLKGFWIDSQPALAELATNLESLASEGPNPLLFAVGDGNHSLATAKTLWEEIRAEAETAGNLDSVMKTHPARYALVEVQNCRDPTLVFEPINRLLLGVDGGAATLLTDLKEYFTQSGQGPVVIGEGEDVFHDVVNEAPASGETKSSGKAQSVAYVVEGKRGSITISNPKKTIAVASMTDFLDSWLETHPTTKIDYVHETTAIDRFCVKESPENIGFVFSAMDKADLFKSVVADGVLPRKTFSMGNSHDKRFYFEGRHILPKPL